MDADPTRKPGRRSAATRSSAIETTAHPGTHRIYPAQTLVSPLRGDAHSVNGPHTGYHEHPVRRVGGTGRRDGLKNRCPKGRVGSSPTLGTKRAGISADDPLPIASRSPQIVRSCPSSGVHSVRHDVQVIREEMAVQIECQGRCLVTEHPLNTGQGWTTYVAKKPKRPLSDSVEVPGGDLRRLRPWNPAVRWPVLRPAY